MGHVDSGKCVSGETLLELADGSIIEARKAFEMFRLGAPVERPDGVVYKASGLKVLSVEPDGSVIGRNVSHVWKLRSDRLVRVGTMAGYEVRTTPEHKFLTMTSTGEPAYVEASRLRLGDFLLVPVRTSIEDSGLKATKKQILRALPDDFLIRVTPEFNEHIRRSFARGRRKQAGRRMGDLLFAYHMRKGYYRASVFRLLLKRFGVDPGDGYDHISELKFATRKRLASHKSPWIRIPKSLEEFAALAYLVGLLFGDGIAESGYLTNVSPELISEYKRCLHVAFGVEATQAWRRTCYVVSHKGGKTLHRFLVAAFGYPRHDKSRILDLPPVISTASNELMALFLRGFFDAEGFVQTGRNIGIGCESPRLMKKLPIALHRLGCLAYHGKKSHRNEIVIGGRSNLEAFVRDVGFTEKHKMSAARAKLAASSTSRVFEITPVSGDFIRQVRLGHKVFWDRHFQLTGIEGYEQLSKGALLRMFSAVPSYSNEGLAKPLQAIAPLESPPWKALEGAFPSTTSAWMTLTTS